MRKIQLLLFTASAVLDLTGSAEAATITLGNYSYLLANTAGQPIPILVTDIVPNTVNGMTFSVAIDDGGPAYGGALGPKITAIDVDSGPTIWVPPSVAAGHNVPATYFDPGGQLASVNFLTVSGFVNATSGLLVTLIIDTTGVHDLHKLTLTGAVLADLVGDTEFIGTAAATTTINYPAFGGTGAVIGVLDDPWPPEVPEPSSFVLAALGLVGLAAWDWRRKRRMFST
jgi:PEP-CTERM motif-containing protein